MITKLNLTIDEHKLQKEMEYLSRALSKPINFIQFFKNYSKELLIISENCGLAWNSRGASQVESLPNTG
jgi:hypothetical protein